jgi:predicted Zn-dependent protease
MYDRDIVIPQVSAYEEPTGANGYQALLRGMSRTDIAELTTCLETHLNGRSALYQGPSLGSYEEIFFDLVGYAPGMNTCPADILAVVEAEAQPDPAAAPGRIDPAARALLERARAKSWQTITVPATRHCPAFRVVFDGQGRFAYERLVSTGLKERVICDGQTFWHLYPELAVGARRPVSRFHRAEFARLVPWALPPIEDLARGAHIKLVGERTVAIMPRAGSAHKAPAVYLVYLVFSEDGRLAERRVVQAASGKIIYRETYGPDGVVKRWTAEKGQVETSFNLILQDAPAPDLKPNLTQLVVVPMPLRTRDYLRRSGGAGSEGSYKAMTADAAVALMATEILLQNGAAAMQIFVERFVAKRDRRLGLYTLLATARESIRQSRMSAGRPWQKGLAQSPDGQSTGILPDYLTTDKLLAIRGPGDGFVQRLGACRNLCLWWGQIPLKMGTEEEMVRDAETVRTLAYFRQDNSPLWRWTLLTAVRFKDRGLGRGLMRQLADVYQDLDRCLAVAYASRYESARLLARAGKADAARNEFRDLFAGTARKGDLPRFDGRFYLTLKSGGKGKANWQALFEEAADHLLASGRRRAVVCLAWQCHEVGARALADRLVARALDGSSGAERKAVSLVVLQYLGYTRQYARAEALLHRLLEDADLAREPWLWRLGSVLAGKCGSAARSLQCLEKALDLEFQAPPERQMLLMVRRDYEDLLSRYGQLATACTMLEQKVPADLLARVVQAADRWRALDPNNPLPSQEAGELLLKIGARELAWDYLTALVSEQPDQAAGWIIVGDTLKRAGELDRADEAYAQGSRAEPGNPQPLLSRATLLRRMARLDQSRRLLRQIVEGQWSVAHEGIQDQARVMLEQEDMLQTPGMPVDE